MFSLFPYLLSFPLLAPFVLRIACGYFLLTLAFVHLRHSKSGVSFGEHFGKGSEIVRLSIGALEAVTGILLFAGAFTQLAGLIAALLSLILLFLARGDRRLSPYQPSFHFLLALVCLSFLVLGAGAFAIDLPL